MIENKTAQDVFQAEFLENDEQKSNETIDLLEFMRLNSTHLSTEQMNSIIILHENGLDDIAQYIFMFKKYSTRQSTFMETINKLTMADRIKGNAKLSHLMKSDGLANPASSIKAQDVQAQGMSRREIDRY